jgi:hypothetical protein
MRPLSDSSPQAVACGTHRICSCGEFIDGALPEAFVEWDGKPSLREVGCNGANPTLIQVNIPSNVSGPTMAAGAEPRPPSLLDLLGWSDLRAGTKP